MKEGRRESYTVLADQLEFVRSEFSEERSGINSPKKTHEES